MSVPTDGSFGSCTEVVYNRHLPGTQQHWGFIVGTNGHMSWWSCDRGRSEVSLCRWNVVRPVSSPPCRVVAMTCSQVFFGTGQAATSDSCSENVSSNAAHFPDCTTHLLPQVGAAWVQEAEGPDFLHEVSQTTLINSASQKCHGDFLSPTWTQRSMTN